MEGIEYNAHVKAENSANKLTDDQVRLGAYASRISTLENELRLRERFEEDFERALEENRRLRREHEGFEKGVVAVVRALKLGSGEYE